MRNHKLNKDRDWIQVRVPAKHHCVVALDKLPPVLAEGDDLFGWESNCGSGGKLWRPVSQRWAQRSQQKPTINCPVSPRWLCCRQRTQQKKSLPSSKNRRFVYVCAYVFRNCCLSSSYSALFSAEYRKSSLRNWTPPRFMTKSPVGWLPSKLFLMLAIEYGTLTLFRDWMKINKH